MSGENLLDSINSAKTLNESASALISSLYETDCIPPHDATKLLEFVLPAGEHLKDALSAVNEAIVSMKDSLVALGGESNAD